MANIPLGNAEVLRKVLEQFSNSELLLLSLVNKQWNFEARSVLRGRGNVTARISSVNPCQTLAAFASDLAKIRVVPFSCIHVELRHSQVCRSFFNKSSLDPIYNVILDALPCKHLSVSFSDTWGMFEDCEALELVRKIVEGSSGVLEELSFASKWAVVEGGGFQHFLPDVSLPRLRTLKITGYSFENSTKTFIKALVARAPNLRELKFNGGLLFQENVLEGSAAVLVPLHTFHPLYERMCNSLMGSVRAETIEILAIKNAPFEVELLKTVVPMALQASRISLKTLRMDLLFVIHLMCYGVCLENVTKLAIIMNSHPLATGTNSCVIPNLLKLFDFIRIFPKLARVEIVNHKTVVFTLDQIRSFIERATGVWTGLSPDRVVNIKHLTISECICSSALPLFAQRFPHVQTLVLKPGGGDLSKYPFSLLWERFLHLEELTVATVRGGLSLTVNLDSVFCGIFPEEIAELVQKNFYSNISANWWPILINGTSNNYPRTLVSELVYNMSLATKPLEVIRV